MAGTSSPVTVREGAVLVSPGIVTFQAEVQCSRRDNIVDIARESPRAASRTLWMLQASALSDCRRRGDETHFSKRILDLQFAARLSSPRRSGRTRWTACLINKIKHIQYCAHSIESPPERSQHRRPSGQDRWVQQWNR